MTTRRLGDAAATARALFNDAQLFLIRPTPTAPRIGDRKDLYFGSVSMVGHSARSTPRASNQKDGPPRRLTIFDTEILGLAAKVQCSGTRTFTLDYRFAGRQRRMTIGRWPEWSATAARERAKELRRMIDEGQDPLAAKEDLREAPRIKDMIDRYIREHLPKLAPANAGDQISMLRKMVEPAWGRRRTHKRGSRRPFGAVGGCN